MTGWILARSLLKYLDNQVHIQSSNFSCFVFLLRVFKKKKVMKALAKQEEIETEINQPRAVSLKHVN